MKTIASKVFSYLVKENMSPYNTRNQFITESHRLEIKKTSYVDQTSMNHTPDHILNNGTFFKIYSMNLELFVRETSKFN